MPDPEAPQPHRSRLAALIAAGTVAIALVGAIAFIVVQMRTPADRFAACRAVQLAGGLHIGGPFELTDQTGARISDAQILAKGPALIYFGYTFCPDVCPVDVARNAAAVDLLAKEGLKVTPVFITVDPGRDTPKVLADYAAAMHPDMIGLTGTPAEIRKVEGEFGVIATRQEGGDSGAYSMNHTTLSYLAIPGAGVVALFSRDIDDKQLASRAACFLKAAKT